MAQKKRYIFMDVLRIMACLFVLYNHSWAYEYYTACTGIKRIVYLIPAMVVRADVPIFFMISGALLFKRETDYKKIFPKIWRFFICLVLFSLIVFIGYSVIWGDSYSPVGFMATLLRGLAERMLPGSGAYWYLYGHLGLLFMLPILQRAIKDIKTSEYLVLFVLHVFFWTLIPLIDFVGQFTVAGYQRISFYDAFEVPLATQKAFFFAITGYYVNEHIDASRWTRQKRALFAVSGAGGVLLMAALTWTQGRTFGFTHNYVETFDYWSAIVLFVMVKYWCRNLTGTETWHKVISGIGTLTFGVYLFDPVLHMLFDRSYSALTMQVPTFIKGVGWTIGSFAVGGVLTWLLKKVPGVKKIL